MTKTRNRVLAVAGALSVLALAACSTNGTSGESTDGDSTGVTDTTVTIGTHQPLTGPAAAGFASISAATAAYFDYINDNGGINGRTIDYIVKDDGYNPANTTTVINELVLEDEVFAILGGLGTPTHSAVLDYLNEKEVPDLFVSSGSSTWNDPEKYPYTFAYNTSYSDEATILAHYAQTEFEGKTYCLFGQDDDFGEEFEAGLEGVLGEDSLAASERYTVSNSDVVAQISAMKAAGCEVNFLATINGFTASAIGTAAKLGYFPQWLSSSSGGDYGTIDSYLTPNTAKLMENFTSTFYLSFYSDTDEWAEHFSEVNDEYNGGADFSGNTIYGMSLAYQFAEALANAGENPTRESLIAALEEGKAKGNGYSPLGFAADSHAGYTGGRLSVVHDGVQAYEGPSYIVNGSEVTEVEPALPALPAKGIPTASE